MNTKDITSENSNILLIGDSGSKKTTLLGHVPGIYVFDFDKGMSPLRDISVEYDTFKDLARDMKGGPEMEKQGLYEFGKGWMAFWKKVQEVNDLFLRGKGPKAVGLDSLTFMSMLAVNKILVDSGHDLPHQGTWNAHHQYFKEVFSTMTAWPTRLIATAHIERTQNDLTGISEKLPLLVGKLAGLTGAFFDEVYFCEVAPNTKGELEYVVKTQMTLTMRQAKSRWNVPNNTKNDWNEIAKHLPDKPGITVTPAQQAKPAAKPQTVIK